MVFFIFRICSASRRYTACSFRATDERPPYGSLSRLHELPPSGRRSADRLDGHDSALRPDSQSRHSSVRDLSANAQAVLGVPGNGIRRVLEEDGATA